jgi:6-phosphogluconolactonase (cycloisomerase 2 family)
LLAITLASCGGSGGYGGGGNMHSPPPPPPTTYSIGGTVSGLSGSGLVLQNNGGDNLSVTSNGTFTFATKVASGDAYAVTVLTQPSNPAQTCTVTNGSGMASANVTNVAVSCASSVASVTIGGAVSRMQGTGLVLEDNGGDDLTVSADGAFTFKTALAVGANYSITVKTQPSSPSQYCVVSNGAGTTGSTNITNVEVMCAEFAYTASNTNGTIYAYTVNSTTGALTQVGSPYPDGTAPAAVSLAPNGMFAYSATDGGAQIYAYTIDQSTGALTAVTGSPFSTGFKTSNPDPDIEVDPTSHYLYIASSGTHVAGFAIDQTTGALTPLAGSPYTAGTGANGIPVISPNGQFLYVVDQSSAGSVSGYAIDPATGVLTAIPGSPFSSQGADPDWISFTPDGKYAYVADNGMAYVAAFSVDSTTGALTPLSPTYKFDTDGNPMYLTIDASGSHLYLPTSQGASNGFVDVYTINSDGTLTELSADGSPYPVGIGPKYVSIDPSGKFAYVPSAGTGGTGVYGFAIDSTTGALSPMTGSPFASGGEPQFLTIDPSGRFAYTPNQQSADISQYSIGTDGTLTAIGTPIATGAKAGFVSVSPEESGFRD